MPTADSFTALGKGNGFNRCLSTSTVSSYKIINPPTFEQTVAAYWNFHSASFSGASFEPGNEPRDLICTENANRGSDSDSSGDERFFAGNSGPYKVKDEEDDEDDEIIYYAHGIGFGYFNREDVGVQGGARSIDVYYTSTITPDIDPIPYSCTVLRNTTSGGGSYSYGKLTTQKKVAVSGVDIGGVPFAKMVVQSFTDVTFDDPVGSGNATCLTPSFLPEPSSQPSLTLWDY